MTEEMDKAAVKVLLWSEVSAESKSKLFYILDSHRKIWELDAATFSSESVRSQALEMVASAGALLALAQALPGEAQALKSELEESEKRLARYRSKQLHAENLIGNIQKLIGQTSSESVLDAVGRVVARLEAFQVSAEGQKAQLTEAWLQRDEAVEERKKVVAWLDESSASRTKANSNLKHTKEELESTKAALKEECLEFYKRIDCMREALGAAMHESLPEAAQRLVKELGKATTELAHVRISLCASAGESAEDAAERVFKRWNEETRILLCSTSDEALPDSARRVVRERNVTLVAHHEAESKLDLIKEELSLYKGKYEAVLTEASFYEAELQGSRKANKELRGEREALEAELERVRADLGALDGEGALAASKRTRTTSYHLLSIENQNLTKQNIEHKAILDDVATALHDWSPGSRNAYVPLELPGMVKRLRQDVAWGVKHKQSLDSLVCAVYGWGLPAPYNVREVEQTVIAFREKVQDYETRVLRVVSPDEFHKAFELLDKARAIFHKAART